MELFDWSIHYSHMTNHPGKPPIQKETWVSIHPNFHWVGYHPLKAVGTSIFTHGQVCLSVTSNKSLKSRCFKIDETDYEAS